MASKAPTTTDGRMGGGPLSLRLIYLCTSNVCRSPLAEAVAASIVASRGLGAQVEVLSRGLTDGYSRWGHPAEPRMCAAAAKLRLDAGTMARLAGHGSTLLTRAEAEDPRTLLFLVTAHHADWATDAVGADVMSAARAAGRVRLIDSAGGDVADPFFGGEEEYETVAAHVVSELPRTLDKALRDYGVLPPDAPACLPPVEDYGASASATSSSLSSSSSSSLAAAAEQGRKFGARQGAAYAPPGAGAT